jgi:transcriptional regulator with XRE-family HTH domain
VTKFREFRLLLEGWATEAKAKGLPHSNDRLAKFVGVGRSAVYAWMSGDQRPRPKQLDKIAEYFSNGFDPETPKLREQLYKTAGYPLERSAAHTDPLKRAIELTGPIRVGFVKFDDSGIGRFERDLFAAFLDFCGFAYQSVDVEFADVRERIVTGGLDLAVGHLQTPDRLRAMRYVALPISIGINGISYDVVEAELHSIDKAHRVSRMVAVMNNGQASYGVARSVLRLPEARIVNVAYDVHEFVRAFNELFVAWNDDSSKPLPVVVTDEVMCRNVYKELVGNHQAIGKPSLLWCDRGANASGESSDVAESLDLHFDGRLLAAHPRYNLAYCVRREGGDEWFAFLEDAWHIFLRGNIEFVRRLCENLEAHFDEKISELALLAGEADAIWRNRKEKWLPGKDQIIDLHNLEIWRVILENLQSQREGRNA